MKTLTAPPALPPRTVAGWNWLAMATTLDDVGYAVTPTILSPADCAELIALYDEPDAWRDRIEHDRYRLGPSEYQRFQQPLPDTVTKLRADCYEKLAPIANSWQAKQGVPPSYPDNIEDFLETCHSAGQHQPAPMISRHQKHGFTCLHQQDQDDVRFPMQLTVLLSKPTKDHTGGEFVMVEQLPRAQSRARVVPVKQGQGVIHPTAARPGTGNRGHYRIGVRTGVSTVHAGTRYALTIPFQDTT